MNEPTCKDCPAFGEYPIKTDVMGEKHICHLMPDGIFKLTSDWCYLGRLIMAVDSQGGLLYHVRKLADPYGRGKAGEGDF